MSFNLNFGDNNDMTDYRDFFKEPIYTLGSKENGFNKIEELNKSLSGGYLPGFEKFDTSDFFKVLSPGCYYLPARKKIKFLVGFYGEEFELSFS